MTWPYCGCLGCLVRATVGAVACHLPSVSQREFLTTCVDALKKQETDLMNTCYHIIRTSGFDRKKKTVL